jgi:tetratricopeptide (TPR) repeat protein
MLENLLSDDGCSAAAASRKSLGLVYNDIGVQQVNDEQLEAAVQYFGRAIDASGASVTAAPFSNRADCLRRLDRPSEALADYERAAELAVAEPEALWQIRTRMAMLHNDAGTRLYNHAQARKAAQAFSRAIECNPRVSRFYLNRAEAAVQLSRFELARDDLLVALRLDPGNHRARTLLAGMCPS